MQLASNFAQRGIPLQGKEFPLLAYGSCIIYRCMDHLYAMQLRICKSLMSDEIINVKYGMGCQLHRFSILFSDYFEVKISTSANTFKSSNFHLEFALSLCPQSSTRGDSTLIPRWGRTIPSVLEVDNSWFLGDRRPWIFARQRVYCLSFLSIFSYP